MRWIAKLIAWAGVSCMMLGIVGLVGAILVFNHYSKGLPSFESLAEYSPPVLTRLYAANGKLLAEYAKQKRIFVPLKAIPDVVKHAFVAAEDKNFYTHKGVDIYGIARAMRENIANYGSGRSMVGGSTITQQVVKNFLLTNEKSFERKIKEAILAYRISQVYSKDQILELYLNDIYLGNGSYGVAAAALNYFNKGLEDLTVEEAALLAAMPKAPANYDPRRNYDGALNRRNYVLGRMQADGYINDFDYQRALHADIVLEARAKDDVVKADFFAEEVRRDLARMYGSDVLYEGGLAVKTTVDEGLQKIADDALRAALIDYDRRYGYRGALMSLSSIENWEVTLPAATEGLEIPLYDGQKLAIVLRTEATKAVIGLPDGTQGVIALSELEWARKDLPGQRLGAQIKKPADVLAAGNIIIVEPIAGSEGRFALHQIPEVNGALVALNPHSGRVMAMSGGYSYIKTEFNRATQAERQPGSAFKPLVYMAAFENGFTPSTVVVDEPIEINQGPGKPLWRPQNYGGQFLGATTLRIGLEKSRNTITVRLAQMLGIGRVINVAKRLGVYEGKVPRNYSMVLGAAETTLLNMVTAYATIANGGFRVESSLIERIDDRNGEVIYRRDSRQCVGCQVDPQQPQANPRPPIIDDARPKVIDERVAYQVVSLMEGVATRGTAASARKEIGKPVAGKTGTTNDSRDAWFIGFSPDLVVGVYIGYDRPRSLGNRETGGRVALPAFIDFMKKALADEPAKPFRMPQGIRMVQVDLSTGLPPAPGIAPVGKIVPEAFIVGGNIYKPPLPADAEDEGQLAAYDVNSEIREGFDPHADWEDTDHYMSPQRAYEQDYRYQEHQQPAYSDIQDATQLPGYVGFGAQQSIGNTLPPAPQQGFSQGYDINRVPSQQPAAQQQPAFEMPQPASGATSYGTGGIY